MHYIHKAIIALLLLTASPVTSAPDRIKVLIIDGFNNHDWKATTETTKKILNTTDLFTVETSTAPATTDSDDWQQWRPEFKNYDVVIQNCNSIGGGPSWPKAVQNDLETFVKNGGGLFVLHSGNNAFPEWNEYNKMIGLGWRKKDFGAAITINDHGETIKIPAGEGENTGHGKKLDTLITSLGNHPIHQDLPKQWMAAELEVYRYARGPAENLTVISYANEAKTQLNFPIEWVVRYGKGNVYVSTYGHAWKGKPNPPGMRCVAFHTSLIRGLEWLANGQVTYPVPANFPTAQSIQLN